MYTYLQQPQPRVVIHATQVVEKKWKLRVRFGLTKENRVHQTKILTKIDKIRTKNSRYWMLSLVRLCSVF